MHGRERVGLGDLQDGGVAPIAIDRRRVVGGHAQLTGLTRVAQQAQAGAGHDAQATVLVTPVLLEAEEDEVAVAGPAQERGDLVGVLLGRGQARTALGGDRDEAVEPALQRSEVDDDGADGGQHVAGGVLEVGELLGAQPAVELEVHDRLARRVARMLDRDDPVRCRRIAAHADDRMGDADDPQPARRQLGADRVDQERQVVGGGLQHRAGRLVAVLLAARGERAHAGDRATAPVGQRKGAAGLGQQRLGILLGRLGVSARRAAQVGADEAREGLRVALAREPGDHLGDPVGRPSRR